MHGPIDSQLCPQPYPSGLLPASLAWVGPSLLRPWGTLGIRQQQISRAVWDLSKQSKAWEYHLCPMGGMHYPQGLKAAAGLAPHTHGCFNSAPQGHSSSIPAVELRPFADPTPLVVLHQAGTSVVCECTELGQVCSSKQQSVAILSMQPACLNAGKDGQSPGSKPPFCFIPLTAHLSR